MFKNNFALPPKPLEFDNYSKMWQFFLPPPKNQNLYFGHLFTSVTDCCHPISRQQNWMFCDELFHLWFSQKLPCHEEYRVIHQKYMKPHLSISYLGCQIFEFFEHLE